MNTTNELPPSPELSHRPSEVETTPRNLLFGSISTDLRWPLVLGAICLLPLLFIHGTMLWSDPSLRFFPLLILVSVAWIALGISKKDDKFKTKKPNARRLFGFGIACLAAGTAIAAGVLYSTWLGVAAWVLVLFCLLLISVPRPWYQLAAWTLPLAALLCLPHVSSSFDQWFDQTVLESSGALMDLASVPNLVEEGRLQIENRALSAEMIRNVVSSPYLLFSITLIMVLLMRTGAAVGLVMLLMVPLWAWFQNTIRCFAGVLLLEYYELNTFLGRRHILTDIAVLLAVVFAIFLMVYGVKQLLQPFKKLSTTSSQRNEVHRLFNRVVLWPAKDPNRRKSETSDQEEHAMTKLFLPGIVLALCFATTLGFSIMHLLRA